MDGQIGLSTRGEGIYREGGPEDRPGCSIQGHNLGPGSELVDNQVLGKRGSYWVVKWMEEGDSCGKTRNRV